MNKLTIIAVNSAKQLSKHMEEATRTATLGWANGYESVKLLIKPYCAKYFTDNSYFIKALLLSPSRPRQCKYPFPVHLAWA